MPTPRKHSDRGQRQRAYRQRQQAVRTAEIRSKGLPAHAPIPAMPSTARWNALTHLAQELLRTARMEMETYRDDRSDTWQESHKAADLQENIDRIDEALGCLAET